jgi:hypothetical protein
MTEDNIDTSTAEELFQQYMEAIYKVVPDVKTSGKYKILVAILQDSFMTGIAIGQISKRSFATELLAYIDKDKEKMFGVLSKEGWIN